MYNPNSNTTSASFFGPRPWKHDGHYGQFSN